VDFFSRIPESRQVLTGLNMRPQGKNEVFCSASMFFCGEHASAPQKMRFFHSANLFRGGESAPAPQIFKLPAGVQVQHAGNVHLRTENSKNLLFSSQKLIEVPPGC